VQGVQYPLSLRFRITECRVLAEVGCLSMHIAIDKRIQTEPTKSYSKTDYRACVFKFSERAKCREAQGTREAGKSSGLKTQTRQPSQSL
jgi:hypothetical protein